jgi:outer membrane protein insertion porin family/translocation and assembly module TamA
LSDTGLYFNKFIGDASRYIGLSGPNVLAFRIRGGTVFGRTLGEATGFIPPSERLYAGGPTTVRGFSQNELGSLIYISRTYAQFLSTDTAGRPDTVVLQASNDSSFRRVVPVGGNSLFVANLELRLRSPFLPELLQWTLFTDAGEVWNRGTSQIKAVRLKVTPGIQLTAFSPVGPVRVAVGYNPYRRPNGPIYYEATDLVDAPLLCVSPLNDIPTHFEYNDPTDPNKITKITQAPGSVCRASYQPAKDNRFRSKLTFSFAIGQAF